MSAPELSALIGTRGPAVLVQREAESVPFATISVDNAYGVRLALEHLHQQGHRHIAHIAGVRRDGEARQIAYEIALTEVEAEPKVLPSDSTEAGGIGVAELLNAHPEITAVFCSNDRIALGLYYALQQRGVRVPEDISVVGFDDLPWAEYLTPPLTTVRQLGRYIGSLAARLLLGGAAESKPVLVQPELVVRASVSSVMGGDLV